MASEVPRQARLALPAWFWGGDVDSYFTSARLRASRDDATNAVTVEVEERAGRTRPQLVRTREIFGPNAIAGRTTIESEESFALNMLGLSGLVRSVDTKNHLERLVSRASGPPSPSSIAAGLAMHQLQTVAASVADIDNTLQAIFEDIKAIRLAESGAPAFPYASVHFVSRDEALMHRTRLAPVMLRLQHDDALRSADLREVLEANARGELIFATANGIGDGFATLDAYLSPLLGALSPFVWAVPAQRASGTLIFALGSHIAGTEGEAAEPLQLLPSRGPSASSPAPRLTNRSAEAAIQWWIRRIDGMFGVVSDPATFCDVALEYVPSKHLHAQLSVEQLFRRTASIQRAHRDSDTRRVLLFSTLDTLERLSSRTLTKMCTLSFAQRTLERVRASMSDDVARVLMPAAERAVAALAQVQEGFFLARQLGRGVVEFTDVDGNPSSLSLEAAAAEYIRVLRNATHGHGSNRKESKLQTDALLAHHNGQLGHDLAQLGYLYLLELLTRPDNLRRTLWDAGAA